MKIAPVLLSVLAWSIAPQTGAQAADWTVDAAKSKLGFVGSQSGEAFDGHFAKWNAKITFDPANPGAGKAVVTIDMASAATGDRQKDESLPQAEWFDVKAFPQARFEASSFRATGPNAYEAVGSLSIRNAKKDVTLPFTLAVTGDQAHAVGKLPIIRTDYGVGQGAWASGQYVALDVAVTFDLWAQVKP